MADDLLKNDGQKFLEMMEQLAERRMMREEEAAASIEEDSDDEDQDEDEEDEEDDEDDEDEDDEEEVSGFVPAHCPPYSSSSPLTAHHDRGAEDARRQTHVLHLRCAYVRAEGPPSLPRARRSCSPSLSTNSQEERERIKEFWLKLGEQERRDLVKVEKEAVLKKMKEQQKHSCSCAVCGRKRFVYICVGHLELKCCISS